MTPDAFVQFPALRRTFAILATARDAGGRAYVAAAEGTRLPLSGTQFHPEKAVFEWNRRLAIPRGGAAAAAARHVAAFLGEEARRSRHLPADAAEEDALLIANHCAVFTGAAADDNRSATDGGEGQAWSRFDEVYFFPPWGDAAR